MSTLPAETRAAAVRALHQLDAADLIPVLGLDRAARGRPAEHTGCDVDGCGAPHFAKGLCRRHYYRQYHAERKAAGRVTTHGATGYGLGCRCGTCVGAKRVHWARSNERRKVRAA